MSETGNKVETTAKELGNRSASFLARFGLNRLASGVLLVVLGVLVLAFPELIVWTVGIGSIVLGILVLAYSPGVGS